MILLILIDIILLFIPLIIVQIVLSIYCIHIILSEGVDNFNKLSWSLICIFVNIIGPISFLIIGRKKELR